MELTISQLGSDGFPRLHIANSREKCRRSTTTLIFKVHMNMANWTKELCSSVRRGPGGSSVFSRLSASAPTYISNIESRY